MIARQRHHFEEHIVVVRRRSYQFQFLVAHRFQWKIERGLHDGPKFSPGFSQGTGATRTRTRTTFFFFFFEKQEARRTNFWRHTNAACSIVYCISTEACYHTWVIFLH